jgi:hypothetical protein
MTPRKQSSTDKFWKDEAGLQIPFSRVKKSERLKEKTAYSLAMRAISLNRVLGDFKGYVIAACNAVIEAIREDNKVKTDTKGNYTWYNFDQSIKIQVDASEIIRFDETLIDAAKEKLMKLINENVSGDDFIKTIVMDAFQTSSGRLDTRRILSLKKHTSRITKTHIKEKWEEAMELIDKSISRPESRTYFRVWVRDESGEYQHIDLNFSSIKPQ